MNETNVSIIVPCYNCGKYIEENIQSVLNQTFKKFEAIYINDGSKDNTLEILKEYEKKDNRIKVIDIKNGGVSHARNLGLDNVKGEYIAFIDSDDYIADEYIEKLYNATENKTIDYVRCLMMNRKKIEVEEKVYYKQNEDFKETYDMLLNTYQLNPVWCGLVKSEIIQKNKIRFKENFNYLEDYIFNIEILKYSNTLKYINYNGYFYRVNEESLTNKFEKDKIINKLNMTIYAYKELYTLFPSNKDKEQVDKKIESEVRKTLDAIFYATTKTKLRERIKIYENAYEILKKESQMFKSVDILLLINKQFILFDLKNNITKKIPRKLKHKILKTIK